MKLKKKKEKKKHINYNLKLSSPLLVRTRWRVQSWVQEHPTARVVTDKIRKKKKKRTMLKGPYKIPHTFDINVLNLFFLCSLEEKMGP